MFSRTVDFVNARWVTHTIFTRATFENFVPDFRGATMHEATEWHGPSWPKPPQDKGAAQEQVYAYERLKLEMERGSRSTRMSCNFSAGSCVRAADCSSLGPGLTLVAVGVNFDVHLPPRCSIPALAWPRISGGIRRQTLAG